VGNWLFQEVLERLLDLVTIPVKQALCQEKTMYSSELVQNCCHLLARVVAELASQSSGTDVSVCVCGHARARVTWHMSDCSYD
jgi:hypothetical protein